MASAMHPNDTTSVPSYGFKNESSSQSLYQCPPPPPYSTSIISQPAPIYVQSTFSPITGVQFVSHNPVQIQCPRCRQEVVTCVQYEAGVGTWLIAFGICFFGGIFGCCLIPFCFPTFQDAIHSCPSCGSFIGRRNLI